MTSFLTVKRSRLQASVTGDHTFDTETLLHGTANLLKVKSIFLTFGGNRRPDYISEDVVSFGRRARDGNHILIVSNLLSQTRNIKHGRVFSLTNQIYFFIVASHCRWLSAPARTCRSCDTSFRLTIKSSEHYIGCPGRLRDFRGRLRTVVSLNMNQTTNTVSGRFTPALRWINHSNTEYTNGTELPEWVTAYTPASCS